MVESLKELNKLCQKPNYKTMGNWMVRTFLRDAALPCTWLLLHTPITAMQVTLASLLIGLAGCLFLAIPGTGAFVMGIFLIQFWYYLDHVDGQIARYRNDTSLTGKFFDFFMHHVVHAGIFFALGVYTALFTGSDFFYFWGFTSSLSIMLFNMYYDLQSKTLIGPLSTPGVILKSKTPQIDSAPVTEPISFKRKLFSLLHKSCEVHVVMNLLTLFAVLEWWMPGLELRKISALYWGIAAPIIMGTKYAYAVKTRRIDHEFAALVESGGSEKS